MTNITGLVDQISYRNEATGFTVLRLNQNQKQTSFLPLVTVVGSFEPAPQPDEELTLVGDWKKHPKYGDQFQAERISQRKIAQTPDALAAYLASGIFQGIGPSKAQSIVNAFGMGLGEVITRTPERLAEVKGISTELAAKIAETWKENEAAREVMVWLCGFGLTTNMAVRIYQRYKSATIPKVSENPYRLSSDVDGIGFVKADDVARPVLGDTFKVDMPYRIRAGLVHTLREARSNGHVFLPYGVLVSDSANLLNIQAGSIRPVLDGMPDLPEPEIIIDQGDQRPVYLVKLYDAERLAAHQLKLIAANTGRLNDLKESLAEKITAAETGLGFTLTEQQRAAVFMALSNKVSIITGGPGVGKSTILKLVTDVLAASHKSFALCSPTGRASKRLAEATKQSASTIHRLLEFNPLGFFAKCEENPINADVIIVDEMSMVDMSLFHFLLKAVPISTHLLMVGDADQLPSVGAGDVLHELIRSQQFPVTTLTNIFRQGKNSHIVSNAHEINAGHMPDLIPFPDWLYIEANDQESIQRAIVEAVCNQLPKAGYSPTKDVQVLLPMYKTEAGVNKLNMMLRERLNPMKAGEVERKFRAGDKVMQLKNNYQLGVFNGDMGYVADIRLSDDVMVIDMDGHSVEYPLGGLDQLTLAYACTIHKSQGSEYPVVVMGLSSSHYIMLKRNLIYTGITRGKQLVILVGDKAAIQTAVKRAETAKRYTLLSNRLKGTQGA